MSFVGFLQEDLREGNLDEVADSLARIEKAHKRMQQLIDDLLQLSRVGRLELKIEDVDLNQVLAGATDYVGEKLDKSHFQLEIAPDFPLVKADRARMHQIFENLLNNAVKYGSDTPDLRIRVFWEEHPDEIRICVADNGPGIAPEYHQKIFGLFQRLDTSKEGTGVGLAIVSRTMELHGGTVWVESTPGQGAAFWLSFPKQQHARKEDNQ